MEDASRPRVAEWESDDDDDSSSSDPSVYSQDDTSAGTNHHSDQLPKKEEIAGRDTTRQLRTAVILLIILLGALVASLTYVMLNNEETEHGMNSYELFTQQIYDISASHFNATMTAFAGMSRTLTSSAAARGERFPFVTLPAFEVEGHHLLEEGLVETFTFLPLVGEDQYDEWIDYAQANQGWLDESRRIRQRANWATNASTAAWLATANESIPDVIYNGTADSMVRSSSGPYLPWWQSSPPPLSPHAINDDYMTRPWMYQAIRALTVIEEGVLTSVLNLENTTAATVSASDSHPFHEITHQDGHASDIDEEAISFNHPHSALVYPVYTRINRAAEDRYLAGVLMSVVTWDLYLTNLLPDGIHGVLVVVENTCGQSFSYSIDGNKPNYLGPGYLLDERHDKADSRFVIPLTSSQSDIPGHCDYSLVVYATAAYAETYQSNLPEIFATVVAAVFVVVILTFMVYDCFVQKRNNKVVQAALRSTAILSSLFPENIQSRLFEGAKADKKKNNAANKENVETISGFLTNGNVTVDADEEEMGYKGKPIADLFPETSVLFADIAGFTAWSSVREPAQVFMLLETLYKAFDEIARRRRVFKVETIGDCYVAVTGLPDPRKDHAVAMARFAKDCMFKMQALVKRLEISLGPDTGDLSLRVGIHSGPVTAGVLRGERSRFQLFGDTMNTASRMESTGLRGRIQVSQETADLLIASGKERWVSSRHDRIVAKGKGEMQTYWLVLDNSRGSDQSRSDDVTESQAYESEDDNEDDTEPVVTDRPGLMERRMSMMKETDQKVQRLVDWNVDVLSRLLKQVIARRMVLQERDPRRGEDVAKESEYNHTNHMVIEEVQEIITLPDVEFENTFNVDKVTLSPAVQSQLADYVSQIARMYRNNPFHNFEHASHVAMSVVKLLSRIVAPSRHHNELSESETLHDHTYGITSDPLTQFACILSALIHDVDHPGVPNTQLVKEGTDLAKYYKNTSVAEQNSVDLAWHLFMDDNYKDLRAAIYTTHASLTRFRQLLVNSVMATDIVDKELKMLRNARWAKAFSEEANAGDDPKDAINRKATIVIEHLIQASDVAHTMQHWHIYRKWNERFFFECYEAWKSGRAENNPADGWYEGEIGFYDFYIIPLARKLKDCGVFGVSSDEYLNYAMKNRKEWEERGREVVAEMVNKVKSEEQSDETLG